MINNIKRFVRKVMKKRNDSQWADDWKKMNDHNNTSISKVSLPKTKKISDIVKVGNGTYGHINLKWFCNDNEYLEIGNYCSIANGVIFITGGNHYIDRLSSFPYWVYYDMNEDFVTPTKGAIIIKDDVWIGTNSIILSGVTVGQGAIIGAGSVVAKDVPPYAIYAGNRVVKYRFDKDIIDKLLLFDYSSLSPDDIVKNKQYLNSKLDKGFFESDFYQTHLKSSELFTKKT